MEYWTILYFSLFCRYFCKCVVDFLGYFWIPFYDKFAKFRLLYNNGFCAIFGLYDSFFLGILRIYGWCSGVFLKPILSENCSNFNKNPMLKILIIWSQVFMLFLNHIIMNYVVFSELCLILRYNLKLLYFLGIFWRI